MIRAFIQGVVQFRYAFTSRYTSYRLSRAFDAGREFAHFVTLRRFED